MVREELLDRLHTIRDATKALRTSKSVNHVVSSIDELIDEVEDSGVLDVQAPAEVVKRMGLE